MAQSGERAGSVAERHPRLSLFVRSQLPVAASLAILRVMMWAFDIPVDRPALFGAGAITVGVLTIAALALPWERWPVRYQAIPATLDILALVLVAVSRYEQIDSVGVLAALPAIWLAVVAGWTGVAIGILGCFAASLLPLAFAPVGPRPQEWAATLLIAGVLSVAVVVARILTARYESAARSLRQVGRERMRAADESARLGAMLRSFADGVDVGVLCLDEAGEPVLFNEPLVEFGRLAHFSSDLGHALRMYDADQVTPLAPDRQPLQRIQRGETIEGLVHWVGPRGAQRALIANGRPVQRPDGSPAGAILITQDVTDVMRAGRAREDALATLAHELRTPLTSIVGYTDLLGTEALPPTAVDRVEVIARNAEQLLSLTAVFLDGLHREAAVHRERMSVREVVEQAIDVLCTTPGFAARELVVDVPEALTVSADREGIAAVLMNLLGNAVKFSGDGDRIQVSAVEDGAWMSITVRNSGSRIDTGDLERIFDRFYRGANAQREAVAGTGIGLSVSRDIAVAHGGTLTADEVPDGASFTLCLPRD